MIFICGDKGKELVLSYLIFTVLRMLVGGKVGGSLLPRPHPLTRKKGLVTIESFLGCADLDFLISEYFYDVTVFHWLVQN